MDERSEYILRVRGVTPEQRRLVEELLTRTAKTFRHSGLTRIDRDERGDHAMHLRRKRLV
jgi:hypothetical protein